MAEAPTGTDIHVSDTTMVLAEVHAAVQGIQVSAKTMVMDEERDAAMGASIQNIQISDKWWRLNGGRFPCLARMARDVLAVPVSTVASESAFSTGDRVLDEFRSSLSPLMVEALICTKDWLRSPPSSIDLEEYIKEIEKNEGVTSSETPPAWMVVND